jgi:hypothetical protein
MGLWHFGQEGGGEFFGMGLSRWIRRERCLLTVTDYCRDWGGDSFCLFEAPRPVCPVPDSKSNGIV